MKRNISLMSFLLSLLFLYLFISDLGTIRTSPFHYFSFGLALILLFCSVHLSKLKLIDYLTPPAIRVWDFSFSFKGVILVVVGIIFNIISIFLHLKFDFGLPTINTDLATITYFLSLILLGIGIYIVSPKKKDKGLVLPRKEKIILMLLLCVAFIIRFYKLSAIGHLPEDILWMNQAFAVIDRIIRSPFLLIGDLSTNLPVYPVAILYFLTKNVDFAVRFPSVFYDMLFLTSLFFLVYETLGKRIAFWALAIAVFSIWDVHNSILAWYNLSINTLLITASLLFLVRIFKYGNPVDIFWCGLVLGMAINLFYIPALMILVTFLFIFLYSFFILFRLKNMEIRSFFAMSLRYCLILFAILFLVASPSLVKLKKYPNTLSRHREFLSHNTIEASKQNGFSFYFDQFSGVIGEFGYSPDHYRSDGPWGPALNPVVVFFYHLGLMCVLISLLSPSIVLFFITWAAMFLPVVIMFITGSVWRLINFSPMVFVFSSLGIVVFVDLSTGFITRAWRKFAHNSIIVLLVFLAGMVILKEFSSYFYTRTMEGQNHIFQMCKTLEEEINKLKLDHVWVNDDWCGRTLATALHDKTQVAFYTSVSEASFSGQRVAVVKSVSPAQKGTYAALVIDPNLLTTRQERTFLRTTVTDPKTDEYIEMYYSAN